MEKFDIVHSTETGNTESSARIIHKKIGGADVVEIHDMGELEESDFDKHKPIIIACPTGNVSELQRDWEGYFDELDNA